MATPEVSHGRGGAGNIHPDDTPYADGSVVRAGPEGSHGDGAYSVGRGGAGNIGDAGVKSAATGRADKDIVPPTAYRASTDGAEHHTGRGGAGNEVKPTESANPSPDAAPAGGDIHHIGLADKLKFKLFGKK
ncbi:hypothetical protein SODALDRAFT_320785 [Sodiomyces alkalinus F11]|uniref:Uncharacterized protein n=1 Tax=Sodiomyces alkalinus (strain CBS 110278 / VKM F-3762 / F11) TaxID=1314773 RepID=A0A3N2PLQ2_SODAK|nr:hypothetical protein SODALDRAFT_320785 [Sodiomyces alkalinus F11]ROT35461.1 hypothetical protein SODALDRAFT_320785 [Sodiomyces alkalinus F11]